ncbi:hypothetical protein KY284_019728 [Solanum tuberosum]|nr:hypothetical protein KY284_019728 [Solanum tuberosum]
MGVELKICRKKEFRPRKLRAGIASQRRQDRASPATRRKGQILASPGINFPVDSVPTPRRASVPCRVTTPNLLFYVLLQLRVAKYALLLCSCDSRHVSSCQVHDNSARKWPRQARRNVPKVGMSHLHLQFPRDKLGDLEPRLDSLAREFPPILRRIRELGMKFIFADPEECYLHMVREFYANWAPEARSHFVTVCGRNVPITPIGTTDILGTPQDTDPLVLIGLNIRPPYQAIRHMLCGP